MSVTIKKNDEPVPAAVELMKRMNVPELRKWCREHGVVRSRGDSKFETALKAVEQAPYDVAKYLGADEPVALDDPTKVRKMAEARNASGWIIIDEDEESVVAFF